MRIIENHPNAESVSNQHSRKSSLATKDNANGTDPAKGDIHAPIGTEELTLGGHRGSIPDAVTQLEEDALQKMDIRVELQPIELTKEEEQNNTDAKREKIAGL